LALQMGVIRGDVRRIRNIERKKRKGGDGLTKLNLWETPAPSLNNHG